MIEQPVVLVVGEFPELTPGLVDAAFVRMPIPRGDVEAPAAAVFDLRSLPVADLAVIREDPTVRTLPLLLLSDREIPEAVYELLHADDGVALQGERSGASLERRLALLTKLGRDVRTERLFDEDRRRFERLAAMGTMVAGFAHEVRNPVAAMRSLTEELGEELRDANMELPHVRLILQLVERIERLVKTSLQFGRPAAPKRVKQRPWVIASAALEALRPRVRGYEEILVEADSGLPDVFVDESQLAQALVILLHNAIDATGAASRVMVRLKRGERRRTDPPGLDLPDGAPRPTVRFEVIDDGPGIPVEIVERIFDPFFTTKPTGTGLGLSIAQQIVSENGARLEVVSSRASGGPTTSFTIIAPCD